MKLRYILSAERRVSFKFSIRTRCLALTLMPYKSESSF